MTFYLTSRVLFLAMAVVLMVRQFHFLRELGFGRVLEETREEPSPPTNLRRNVQGGEPRFPINNTEPEIETESRLPINETESQPLLLNVRPVHTSANRSSRQCVTVRFRGDNNNYTVEDALSVMQHVNATDYKIGLEFVEEPARFLPVRVSEYGSNYHMFHFMEMVVIAYSQLHLLSAALPSTDGPTSLGPLSVPWIFVPCMPPSEICGGKASMNCLIADLVLKAPNSSIFQDRSGIVGLSAMENYQYDPEEYKSKAVDRRLELAKEHHTQVEELEFASQANGVMLVERFGCNRQGINKPWAAFIDTFPTDSWHADVMKGLGLTNVTTHDAKLVVGYVDRQNTKRRLPDDHHDWLLSYFSDHEKVEFLRLHMEDYSPIDQIKIASRCDVLIGCHGNGMSHQFWMKPRRYVIELFWKFPYQFDYGTTAQLMKHNYLGIMNGKVIDREKFAHRDPVLRRFKKEERNANEEEASKNFEQEGKMAIQGLIEQAIQELRI